MLLAAVFWPPSVEIKGIVLVTIEEGVHLFPSRTQKLSSPSPMIL